MHPVWDSLEVELNRLLDEKPCPLTMFPDTRVDDHRLPPNMSDAVPCPRCHGQGVVLTAKIVRTQELIRICDECDAVWPPDADLDVRRFVDFGTYMERQGFPGLWDEIVEL